MSDNWSESRTLCRPTEFRTQNPLIEYLDERIVARLLQCYYYIMSCLLNCFVIVCNLVDVCGAVCNHHLAIRIMLHPYFLTTWNIKLYYYVLGIKYQFLLSNNGLSSENACFTWWWYVNMYDFAQTNLVCLFDIHICRTINVLANSELCNNSCTY